MPRLVLIALITVTTWFGASCSNDQRTQLVVASAHGPALLAEAEREFEALHPEIDVVTIYLGSNEILERARASKSRPSFHVIWGADAVTLDTAADENLLAPSRPSWATSSHPGGPRDLWWGVYELPMVLGFNPKLIEREKLPTTWIELADPQWKGKLLLRDPAASGSMRTWLGSLIAGAKDEAGGFDLLARLDANTRSYEGSPELMFERLQSGPACLTVWNLTDLVYQKKSKGYTFLAAGLSEPVPVILDGIALVGGAEGRADAMAFIEHVTSIPILAKAAKEHARIPVRSDFPREHLDPEIASIVVQRAKVDRSVLATHLKAWMKRFETDIRGRSKK